jgi:D-hydroxyproline dehydrogenase subunit beta
VTSRRPDVVVVGAGIVGAACADSLSREGLAVLVLESRFASAGATGAGMGHIVAMDDSPAQLALTARSLALWGELAAELPKECEDEPCGTLWLAADEDEMEAVQAKEAAYRRAGVAAEIWGAAELSHAEPNLRKGLAGALHVPGDRVLYPPNAARFLLARARDRGAEIREGVEVTEIGARSVATTQETVETGAVVNAAGPEAPRLTPGLPIVPRKGHLVITDRYPGFCGHQLVELGYLKSAHASTGPSVAFNLQPRATGQMLLGSSREFAGWDSRVDRRILSRMIVRALDFMPSLSSLSAIRAWTGFRPATPDKLPLIGRWHEDGPWIAAGHEGLGITTAPATAEMLAAIITGRTSPVDPAPFSPNRAMPQAAA